MKLLALLVLMLSSTAFAQLPKIEPGVSQELAKWRSVQYSNISYKLDLTLEKMSPVLRGHMEIRVTQAAYACAEPNCPPMAIILDWRKLPGHEKDSTVSNVKLNGAALSVSPSLTVGPPQPGTQRDSKVAEARASARAIADRSYEESNDHLVFRDGVKMGENVITLDFTSPILTSGSAITRYIDKEDGSEYIYSLFVPSDASTAFPVFDQPDLKARFTLTTYIPVKDGGVVWKVISNAPAASTTAGGKYGLHEKSDHSDGDTAYAITRFAETNPISTYVFAFAAGPWTQVSVPPAVAGGSRAASTAAGQSSQPSVTPSSSAGQDPPATAGGTDTRDGVPTSIYVRRSQAAKFQQHAAETFRLTRAAINYLETYFDYKFPWPKYDLVLIPEFPFGGMEHAGATFLRESSVIFPTEPTKGDEISRANLIFHETAHQWFGDLVTMRWFDDLWLKEGFAEFMAYKTLEHVMPSADAWKVFYERNKQAAYATDSTRGTTPIYQPIANLSAAKSAYGNIVYRKAPSFLRQAEFYLGEDKFQTAVRAFLKKHEYSNATWRDLVGEFERASDRALKDWSNSWVLARGMPIIRRRLRSPSDDPAQYSFFQTNALGDDTGWKERWRFLQIVVDSKTDKEEKRTTFDLESVGPLSTILTVSGTSIAAPSFQPEDKRQPNAAFSGIPPTGTYFVYLPNYGDYGYGIFLLDDKSRDHVLKHIGEEKDPFLRSMMWGALWDSVREAELDPREYVELVIKQLGGPLQKPARSKGTRSDDSTPETDETIIQSLLGRVSTALNYYMPTDAERVSSPSVSEGVQRQPRTPSLTASTPRGDAPAGAPGVGLQTRLEAVLLDRMQHAETPGQRITFYRAFVSNAATERGRTVLKQMLAQSTAPRVSVPPAVAGGSGAASMNTGVTPSSSASPTNPPATAGGTDARATVPLRTKDRFDIVTRLAILGDPDAPKLLADLEKTETSDDAKRYAYAAHAAFATAENRAKYWNDFVNNKDISESWIEAAISPFNSIRYPELSQPYLERALQELPNLKRTRKIFFINNWLSAWIGGQRDERALAIVNKFLADNPNLDNDLKLKILENLDVIERAVRIRQKFAH